MNQLAAIDWGTSSFRIWLINSDGRIIKRIRSNQGIVNCRDKTFESILTENLERLNPRQKIICIISGMITSRSGWIETPYICCPASINEIASRLVSHRTNHNGEIFFVPGICQRKPSPDIMRGEESQLIGLDLAKDKIVILPGTHSKWVKIENCAVSRFTSFMTGEIFELLTRKTTLASVLTSPWSDKEFLSGVADAEKSTVSLLSSLFRLRSEAILDCSASKGKSYLSGFLIGTEIAEAFKLYNDKPVQIVGESYLAELYKKALKRRKIFAQVSAQDITAQGLFRIAVKKGLI